MYNNKLMHKNPIIIPMKNLVMFPVFIFKITFALISTSEVIKSIVIRVKSTFNLLNNANIVDVETPR